MATAGLESFLDSNRFLEPERCVALQQRSSAFQRNNLQIHHMNSRMVGMHPTGLPTKQRLADQCHLGQLTRAVHGWEPAQACPLPSPVLEATRICLSSPACGPIELQPAVIYWQSKP